MTDAARRAQPAPEVPFLDWAEVNAPHAAALSSAAERVVAGGRYVLGPELAMFEKSFATLCGRRHCAGTASGLDALALILRAAVDCGRIPAGSEVLLPANTYIASALAVLHAGLSLALTDPDEASFNLTAEIAERSIGKKTGAVMAVQLYGRAQDMAAMEKLCRDRGVFLISDSAQAHGAHSGGRPAAAYGDAAAFSFYPGKNLGALGDGGAALTDDEDLDARIRMLRNYGSARKYEHEIVGFNSRLDEMQAAMLSAKLPALKRENDRRRAVAERYLSEIKNPKVTLPSAPAEPFAHAWHLFVARATNRDALQAHLHNRGIGTLIHYPRPLHKHAAFADREFAASSFPLSEKLASEVLSLPLNPALRDSQADAVIDAVNAF